MTGSSPPLPEVRGWPAAVGLGLVGAVPVLVLGSVALLLFKGYEDAFVVSATPDSGFNVYIIGAIACLLVAGLLLLAALVSLAFQRARPIGIGYLIGLFITIVALVGFTLVV